MHILYMKILYVYKCYRKLPLKLLTSHLISENMKQKSKIVLSACMCGRYVYILLHFWGGISMPCGSTATSNMANNV